MRVLVRAFLFWSLLGVNVAQSEPWVGAIVNAATGYGPRWYSSSAAEIAQGSLFVVNISNLFGPDAQADGFPLPAELAGVSVRVTVGGATHSAIMLHVGTVPTLFGLAYGPGARYLKALLPSNTPIGEGTLSVTYGGETSRPSAVRVVRRNFGMFTRYRKNELLQSSLVATVQNVNSGTDQPLNTFMNSARPGQSVILWGTGLGPVAGDETRRPSPEDLQTGVEVLVGNQTATVLYAGRSGCCSGVDQIIFQTPVDVNGCNVPIAVRFPDGDVGRNIGTMSIGPDGGTCSDPFGLSPADREKLQATGGLLSATFRVDSDARGEFYRLSGDPLAFGSGRPPFGACLVGGLASPYSDDLALVSTIARVSQLDAGPFLAVTSPKRTAQWRKTPAPLFIYWAEAPFEPGEYTIEGSGGRDVGPFRGAFTLPSFSFRWNNALELENQFINLSQGLTLTWDADPSIDYVLISASDEYDVYMFTCTERADKGRFTVPPYVFQILHSRLVEPLPWEIFFTATGSSFPRRLIIPGLDRVVFEYTRSISRSIVPQ